MAMNQKKSRAIDVNKVGYRYAVSASSWNDDGSLNLNITVQHAEGEGAYLAVEGAYTRDFWVDISGEMADVSEYLDVTPKHIARLIKLALKDGWQPTIKGPPFRLAADNRYLRSL